MSEPETPREPSRDDALILIAHLKERREEKGWSLEDLSDRTRISLHVLQCLEQGDFDVVEAPSVRAFLRTYARVVGVPVEEVNAVFPEPKALVEEPESDEDRKIPIVPRSKVPWGALFKIALGLAVLLILLWWWHPWGSAPSAPRSSSFATHDTSRPDTAARIASPDTALAEDTLAALPAPGEEPLLRPLLPPAPPEPAQPKMLELTATDTVWVQVARGDTSVIYDAIMAPGLRRSWPIEDTLRVNLGRYWAVKMRIGEQEVEVPHFGRRNATSFLCTPSGLIRR